MTVAFGGAAQRVTETPAAVPSGVLGALIPPRPRQHMSLSSVCGRPAGVHRVSLVVTCIALVLADVECLFVVLSYVRCVSRPRWPQPGGVSHSNTFPCWGLCCSPPPAVGVRRGGGCDVGLMIPHSPDLVGPPPVPPLACRECSVKLSLPVWPVPSPPGPASMLGEGAGAGEEGRGFGAGRPLGRGL